MRRKLAPGGGGEARGVSGCLANQYCSRGSRLSGSPSLRGRGGVLTAGRRPGASSTFGGGRR
eukprot:582767-Prorocentrum_minimum.AAC.1